MSTHNHNIMPDLISSSVTVDISNSSYNGITNKESSSCIVPKYQSLGTIYPFLTTPHSMPEVLLKELSDILKIKNAQKILLFGAINVIGTFILLIWCHSTGSMALTAYTYLTIFDIFSLLTCLLTIWIQYQRSSSIYSFGYDRFVVLAVFASTMLAQLGALFIIKESIERFIVQPEIHTGRLLVGTVLAFVVHMVVTYGVSNRAMNHVVAASSSSWLQEHMTDMSESLCHVIPGLSKLLLPRLNPFALIAFAGAIALFCTHVLIDAKMYYSADTWAAVAIALMTWGTMFPMSMYTGKILLQTSPSHIIGQLDKLLREASTLDGVLEFRHEHFWTVSFGVLAGTLQVRVRRDADEQMVLAHVYNRLSNLVSELTIQIFKDDWTRSAMTYHLPSTPPFSSYTPPLVSAGSVTPGNTLPRHSSQENFYFNSPNNIR
ncbi:zinc transporter 6-like isoform X2 [Argonauta hians]